MSEKLTTNFNQYPWFDDYVESIEKNYYRILFKPAIAVQARELTQLQTMIQDQISRFGSYTFKDGSIVDGCAITYVPEYPVVYVSNQFNANNSLDVTSIPSNYLLVANTGVRATVSTAKKGFELSYPETNRFYLNYIYTGKDSSNNDIFEFKSGDRIYVYNENQNKFGSLVANNLIDSIDVITANATANSTATAYGISVSDGIIFQKGFFIKVKSHTIPVRDHDKNITNYVVGFETSEEIIDSNYDTSLLSNAAGFPNYNAPGADRLKLTSTLVSKSRADTANNKNFFAIVEFDSTKPTQSNVSEEGLNKILDVMAVRTNEVSGNFTVKPFSIDTEKSANNQTFNYKISSGITYVNGYRVEKLNSFNVESVKSSTTKEYLNQIVTANFGNYILVNELVGAFNYDNVDEVTLYDTLQKSVSEYEGSNTAPTGNIVGYANILGVQYDSGNKGTPDGKYRVYIFNIRMNNGKSFANDVKSIFSTSTYGPAKADLVLENNLATIKDSINNSLVFSLGLNSVKRLRNSLGINDTSFVFTDIASATMASNGVVTFTTNSPANGGTERLNASVGLLSNSLESNFNIILGSAAYSANLTGTVNTTNTTLTGTGTNFSTVFIPGNMIRVNTGSGYQIRKITAVQNNTSITIDSAVGTVNTAAKFQKYYPQGDVVNLNDFGGTINVLSNTQFTVDTKLHVGTNILDSGTAIVYAQYPVLRSNAVEAKKNVIKDVYVKIDCSNNISGTIGPWDLGLVDVHKIKNVYVGTTYSESNTDRSDWFKFDNGQKDNFYDHAKLVLDPKFKSNITSSTKILVKLDHFVANTSTGVGYFSVDSYPIDDANTSNTSAITTQEIPRYYSSTKNAFIDLRNSIDFRPRKYNTANSANSIATATINPSIANSSFVSIVSGQYIVDPDSNFMADVEYYLPRRDLIVINKNGEITVRKGEPSENPVAPINENDTAILAETYVTAYPSLSSKEALDVGRNDLAVIVNMKTNRVYTQEDIGSLDSRISRMEYYATLNVLEQQAKDMIITDASGLDRFKNGIFADSFLNHTLGKTSDIEYSISIDKNLGIARPKFETHSIDLSYRAELSSGVAKTGNLITMPYTHVQAVNQKYATGTRNVSASVWSWNGKLNLYPTYDHYKGVTQTSPLSVVQDFSENLDTIQSYGDWRTVGTSTSSRNNWNSTTTTTTTNSSRIVTTITPENKTTTVNLGKYVTDVTDNPYIRSREIAFIATGMKPNTRMHVFFDNVLVDEYCAPATPSGLTTFAEGQENKILNRTGNYGAELKSNATGVVYGLFKIPDEKFRAGDRELFVTNVSDLTTQFNSIITKSNAMYTASSISVTVGSTNLTTLTTELNSSTSVETRTTSTSSTVQTGSGRSNDPIAQSFTASVPSNSSGMFLTKIGTYFKNKDSSLGCSVYIVPMVGGFPDSSRIIGKAYLESSEILVSDNASVETQFVLNDPVYLENDKEYAFIVKADGDSPEYNIWTAATGGYDILTGEQVYSNPYSGVLFVSANMNTWTPIQTEDIKFSLYRANYSVGTGTAVFSNQDDEYLKISGLTKANTSYRVEVGDSIIKVVSGTKVTNTANVNYSVGTVHYVDEANDIIYLNNSNGNLSASDVIEFHRPLDSANLASYSANTLIANTTIVSVDNLPYNAIVPRIAHITPAMTSIGMSYKGTDVSFNRDNSSISVIGEIETEFFDKTRYFVSKSNEVDSMSGSKSTLTTVKLVSENQYISPVLDLRRKALIGVENIINNDSANEHTRYGNALTKYVSKNIVLDSAIGPAEDLNAYVGGYRPSGTEIEVYVKVLGSDDNEGIDSKLWTKMTMTPASAKIYSSITNQEDYREFEYNIPSTVISSIGSRTNAYLNNGIIQYAKSDGSINVGYTTFCFKIVLLSSDKSIVPRLADFRAIALQK